MAPGGGCLAGLPGDSTHQLLGFWKRDQGMAGHYGDNGSDRPMQKGPTFYGLDSPARHTQTLFPSPDRDWPDCGAHTSCRMGTVGNIRLDHIAQNRAESSGRIVSAKPASSRHAEKLYTVKGRVMAVSAASLRIQYTADSISKEMVLVTPSACQEGQTGRRRQGVVRDGWRRSCGKRRDHDERNARSKGREVRDVEGLAMTK